MRRSILALAVIVLMTAGSAMAHAQTPDITVEPRTPAPGETVTVTVTGAPPGETVVVRLGVEEESTTVDSSGDATVTIAAPNEPGDAVGTVNIGPVDFPITVTVVVTTDPTTTTTPPPTTTTTTTTTTLPPPTTPPPITGLDDTATLAGIAALVLVVGFGFAVIARRPTTAIVTRGSATNYRIIDGRNGRATTRRR